MKLSFLLVLLSMMSGPSFTQSTDKSERMNQLLLDAGVKPWGKREVKHATIVCKIPRMAKELVCHLRSSGGGEENYDVHVKYVGPVAQYVSGLLAEFSALPSGKRKRQDMEVVCKLKRNSEIINCWSIENGL